MVAVEAVLFPQPGEVRFFYRLIPGITAEFVVLTAHTTESVP